MNKMIALFCAAVIAVSSGSAIVMAEDTETSGAQIVDEASDNTDTEENTDSGADGDTEDNADASDENDADVDDNADASGENDADAEDNTDASGENDADAIGSGSAETGTSDADEAVSATDAPKETDQPSMTEAPADETASATDAPKETDQPAATKAPEKDTVSAPAVVSSGGGGGGGGSAEATAAPTVTPEPTETAAPTATAEPTVTEKPEKDTEKTTTQTTVVMKKPFTLVKEYDDNPFDDCQSGWFKNYVSFAYANGIIKGYKDNTFDPFGKITGSQLAVMLYRISTGKADIVTEGDVWSEEALSWVKANGIMADFADEAFDADAVLTREQIICSIYRSYGLYNKAEEGGKIDNERFPDAGEVSEFALPAMQWAVASKIITGKSDKWIDPLSSVTRAETATIFKRYLENLEFADVPVEVKPASATEKKSDESTAEADGKTEASTAETEDKTEASTAETEDKTEASAAETEDKTEASAAEAAEVKTDAAETVAEPETQAAEAEAPAETAETAE